MNITEFIEQLAKKIDLAKRTDFVFPPMNNPYELVRDKWPYQESVTYSYEKHQDILNWCQYNLRKDDWSYTLMFFAFKTKEAHTWFVLRWL